MIIWYIFYIRFFLKVVYNMQTTTRIMTNLTVYIIVFTLVVCLLGALMSYFYGNIKNINNTTEANSDYSMLNLYFLKITQSPNVIVQNYGLVDNDDTSSYFITFKKDDGTTHTFIKAGDMIYYNNSKICENVDLFKVIVDKSEKTSFTVEVEINDKTYNSQYALN